MSIDFSDVWISREDIETRVDEIRTSLPDDVEERYSKGANDDDLMYWIDELDEYAREYARDVTGATDLSSWPYDHLTGRRRRTISSTTSPPTRRFIMATPIPTGCARSAGGKPCRTGVKTSGTFDCDDDPKAADAIFDIMTEPRPDPPDVKCQDCEWTGGRDEVESYRDFWDRVEPGDVVPAGDCPKCGAFAMLVPRPLPKVTFNKFIPIPEILKRTGNGSMTLEGVRRRWWMFDPSTEAKPFGVPRLPTPEEVAELEKIGFTDWYDWAIAKWGTKWDACDPNTARRNGTEIILEFETAWGPPTPVWDALKERFPDVYMWGQYGGPEIDHPGRLD